MVRVLYWFLFILVVGACFKKQDQEVEPNHKNIKILTYSSFVGKDSFGAWIKHEFESRHPSLKLEFVEARDESGLLGEFWHRKGSAGVDAIIGLDDSALAKLGAQNLSKSRRLSSTPMVFLVNKDRLPKALRSKDLKFQSWSEVLEQKEFKKSALVQDPRFSSPGASWLVFANSLKKNKAREAQGMVYRFFPSWSSSFAAFEQGESALIWTHSTSLSYYRCHSKKAAPYSVLNVEEGTVLANEYYAEVINIQKKESLSHFEKILFEPKSLKKMAELNWVYPSEVEAFDLKECFLPSSDFSILKNFQPSSYSNLDKWIDEWQLF